MQSCREKFNGERVGRVEQNMWGNRLLRECFPHHVSDNSAFEQIE